MKTRNRILLLSSLLLLVSVGGIGNIVWQLPHVEQMQDLKAVLHCLILLGLFGVGLIFSVLELVRQEIMSPIFQLAVQIARLKGREIDGHRLEFTGSKDIDLLTRVLNDLLDGFEKEENLYHIFAEASPDIIYLLDRDGRVLFGNLNAARQWNYQAEEIIGKRQEELFPPDIAKRHKQVIQKIFETGLPVSIDVHGTIGQRQSWIDTRMVPILDEVGHVTAVLGISRDITKRKQAEERLEQVNRCLLSLGPDFKANITQITALCGELLGGTCALYNRLEDGMLCTVGQWHTPPDFQPENIPDGHICYDVIRGAGEPLFIPDLYKTRYAETDPNVRRYGLQSYLGQPVHCGKLIVGSLCVAFQQTFTPTENDKHLLGILASALSVEENRYLAEQKLREIQKKFQDLIETVNDFVWEVDALGHYTYASPRVKNILGYAPEEIIGKSPFDLMPEEEARRVGEIFKSLTANQQAIIALENFNLHKDGYQVVLETNGLPFFDAEGKLKGYRGVDRDVTERKRVEQKAKMLSDAIETAHHGCLIISEDYKVVFGNNYALTKLGFDSDELKNFDLFSLCADREQVKDIIETMKVTKRWMGDIAIIKKDGGQFPALVSVTALGADDDASGRGGDVILFQDITIQKEMREKLLTSEKLAVMGRLTADVAHELNNPLAIVIGGIQLVLSRIDEKAQTTFKSQLETVLRNARRCKTILGNLHDYGRTIGKKEEAVNLPDLIREAIDDVNYQYDMSAIETVFHYSELAVAEITGNKSALLSVFVNLIRNARQAMGEKGRLTVTIEKEDAKHLRIEIRDTGIGMNKEQKTKLFKPFASGWKEKEGSGLGLATSLGIIETHGGSMSAASEGVGKGATFTILLPCEFKRKK